MRKTILLSLIACLSLAAAAPPPDGPKVGASKADLEALQGGWRLVEFRTSEGGAATREVGPREGVAPPPELAIAGDRLRLYGIDVGRLTIDATRRPRGMDWRIDPRIKDGGLSLGIYKIEGARLTVCLAKPGGPRPADFTAPRGSNRELTIYDRAPRP
jgi:uncharacterized protein (TIGR03067 family)